MSDSDGSDSDDVANDTAAQVNNVIQPLRKQLKRQASKIEKLEGLCKQLDKERMAANVKRDEAENKMIAMHASVQSLRDRIDSNPWRSECERLSGELRASENRLTGMLDDHKVQISAHAQVFQSTQSTVSSQSQGLSSLQAEQNEASRRIGEELRALTARLDHMRGEFAERVTHSHSEAVGHADRLVQRVQTDLLALEQEVAGRAKSGGLADAVAATNAELSALRMAEDEIRREMRGVVSQLQDVREGQSSFALKAAVRPTPRSPAPRG